MFRIRRIVSLIVVSFLVSSCGSGQLLLKTRALSQASVLKAHCEEKMLRNENVRRADSLVALSEGLSKKGKNSESLQLADHAVAEYRLAIMKYEILRSEKLLKAAESELSKVQEQVSLYNRVLNELRAARNP